MPGVYVLPGGPPDGQRVGGAGRAVSAVEKRRPCWQGAEEASAASTKHPGGLAGLLSCGHRYPPVNTAFLDSLKILMCAQVCSANKSQSDPVSLLVGPKKQRKLDSRLILQTQHY